MLLFLRDFPFVLLDVHTVFLYVQMQIQITMLQVNVVVQFLDLPCSLNTLADHKLDFEKTLLAQELRCIGDLVS